MEYLKATRSFYLASMYFGLFPFRIDTKTHCISYSRTIFLIGGILFSLSLALQLFLVFFWEPNSEIESFVIWLGDVFCTISAFTNFISSNYYRFERINLLVFFDKHKSVSYKLIKTIDNILLILFSIVLFVQLVLYYYLFSNSFMNYKRSLLFSSHIITSIYDILALFWYTEFINLVLAIYANLLSINSELQKITPKCVWHVQNWSKRYCSISHMVNKIASWFMKSRVIKYI